MLYVVGVCCMGFVVLDFVWVVVGCYDSFWECNLNFWDIVVGIVLVKEVGGFVVEIDDKLDLLEIGFIVVGNEGMLVVL